MVGLIALILAVACFLLAAIGQTLLNQPPLDLAYWGLAFFAFAILWGHPIVAARTGRAA